MTTYRTVGAVAAVLLLSLACAGGDLTLPGPNDPGTGGGGGSGAPQPPGSPLPARLIAQAGDGQSAEPGAVLADPLVVQVLDSAGAPVAGTLVAFSFAGNPEGAALDPPASVTGVDGRASATARLGETAGEQVIVASVASSRLPDLRTRFSVTAVPPRSHGGKGRHHDADD